MKVNVSWLTVLLTFMPKRARQVFGLLALLLFAPLVAVLFVSAMRRTFEVMSALWSLLAVPVAVRNEALDQAGKEGVALCPVQISETNCLRTRCGPGFCGSSPRW